MISLFETPFKLGRIELLSSIASSILLSKLEKSEPQKNLSKLCQKPQYGYTAKASKDKIGPRFVRITDLKEGKIEWGSVPYCSCDAPEKYLLEMGDILIGRTGSVGKSFIVKDIPEPALFASYLIRIRAKTGLMPEFLYWCFQSSGFWDQLLNVSRGSAIKNINSGMLSNLKFPIPSIETQKTISRFMNDFNSFLSGPSLDFPSLPEHFRKEQQIIAKIERVAGKLEEAKGLRGESSVATERFIDSAIVRIFNDESDASWVSGCLGDYVADDCYGTSEKTHVAPIGHPILRMGNIQNGLLDVKDLKYLHIAEKDRYKWILRLGDILVNRTNSAELVGKCAVFDLEGEWGFASYLIRLRLDTERANPYLVARYINSSLGREYMFRERKQMTGQANVNAKKLKALPIKLPPLRQQEKVIEYLDGLQSKVDELKVQQAKTGATLYAMLPSILDRAFKGEL